VILPKRICLLVLFFVGAFLWSFVAVRNAAVWQEPAPLLAGVHFWENQLFDTFEVNPPLPSVITTAPIGVQSLNLPDHLRKVPSRNRGEFHLLF